MDQLLCDVKSREKPSKDTKRSHKKRLHRQSVELAVGLWCFGVADRVVGCWIACKEVVDGIVDICDICSRATAEQTHREQGLGDVHLSLINDQICCTDGRSP